MEPVRGVDHHQIHLVVGQNLLQIGGKDDLGIEGLICGKIRDILLPAVDVFHFDIVPVFDVGDVVFPDTDAEADICNCNHKLLLSKETGCLN